MVVRLAGGVRLARSLRDCPAPGDPVDGDGGPSLAIFVGEVDQQRALVVLDSQPVDRVAFFVAPSTPSPPAAPEAEPAA